MFLDENVSTEYGKIDEDELSTLSFEAAATSLSDSPKVNNVRQVVDQSHTKNNAMMWSFGSTYFDWGSLEEGYMDDQNSKILFQPIARRPSPTIACEDDSQIDINEFSPALLIQTGGFFDLGYEHVTAPPATTETGSDASNNRRLEVAEQNRNWNVDMSRSYEVEDQCNGNVYDSAFRESGDGHRAAISFSNDVEVLAYTDVGPMVEGDSELCVDCDVYDRFLNLLEEEASAKAAMVVEAPKAAGVASRLHQHTASSKLIAKKRQPPPPPITAKPVYRRPETRSAPVVKVENRGEKYRLKALMADPTIRSAVMSSPVGATPTILLRQLRRLLSSPPKPDRTNPQAITSAAASTLITKLATPIPKAVDAVPPLPRLSVDCPTLPVDFIDDLQGMFGSLEPLRNTQKTVRLDITMEFSPYFDHRSADIITRKIGKQAELVCQRQPSRRDESSGEMPETESETAVLATNLMSQLSNTPQNAFNRRHRLGLVCLLFDYRMQLMGTYETETAMSGDGSYKSLSVSGLCFSSVDLQQTETAAPSEGEQEVEEEGGENEAVVEAGDEARVETGIDTGAEGVTPVVAKVEDEPLVAVKTKTEAKKSFLIEKMSLLQVSLDEIPDNIFAIVPVLVDHSTLHEDVDRDGKRYRDAFADTSFSLDFLATESEIDSTLGIDRTEDEWDVLDTAKMNRTVPSQDTTIRDTTRFKTYLTRDAGVLSFALFRRRSAALGWAVKNIASRVPVAEPMDRLVTHVVATMARRNVLPVCIVHVEHCCDCEAHAMTTKHIPGSYEGKALELRTAFCNRLPPLLFFSNYSDVTPRPRVGSFDITFQGYRSSVVQEVFCKTTKLSFPTINEAVELLANIMIPDTVILSNAVDLSILVADGYYKTPVIGARVAIYLVFVGVTVHTPLGSRLASSAVEIEEDFAEEVAGSPSNRRQPTVAAKKGKDVEGAGRSKQKSLVGSVVHNDPTTLLLRSRDTKDAILRRSPFYYRIRSWMKDDVTRWFQSFNTPEHVLENAKAAGVVDGASFALMVNPSSLQAWGVRSRIMQMRMRSSLALLTAPFEAEDPWVMTERESPSGQVCSVPCQNGITSASKNEHVSYEYIGEAFTDNNGSVTLRLDRACTFMFTICSGVNEPYSSNAIRIQDGGIKLRYQTLLAPLMGRVSITVVPQIFNAKRGNLGFDGGVLVAFRNLKSNLRYCGIARPLDDTNSDMGDDDRGGDDKSVMSKESRQSQSQSVASRSIASKSIMSKSVMSQQRKKKVNIQKSSSGVTKGKSFRSLRGHTKVSTDPIKITEVWLPVGVYWSEIDAAVIRVKPVQGGGEKTRMQEDEDDDESSEKKFSAGAKISDFERPKVPVTVVSYDADLAYKFQCRQMKMVALKLQRMYKMWRYNFIGRNRMFLNVIRNGLKQLLYRVRRRLFKKHIIKAQALVRCFICSLRYLTYRDAVVILQTHIRRRQVQARVRKIRRGRVALRRWLLRYLAKQRSVQTAVVKIQCAIRKLLAGWALDRHKLRLRWKQLSRLSAERGREKMDEWARIRYRKEREKAEAEADESARRLIQQRVEQQTKARQEKLQAKQNAAVSLLQRVARGYCVRKMLVSERKHLETRRQQREKQRRRRQRRQLMDSDDDSDSDKDSEEEEAEEAEDLHNEELPAIRMEAADSALAPLLRSKSRKSSEAVAAPAMVVVAEDPLKGVLVGFLNRFVVRIQSLFRMYRARVAYFYIRAANSLPRGIAPFRLRCFQTSRRLMLLKSASFRSDSSIGILSRGRSMGFIPSTGRRALNDETDSSAAHHKPELDLSEVAVAAPETEPAVSEVPGKSLGRVDENEEDEEADVAERGKLGEEEEPLLSGEQQEKELLEIFSGPSLSAVGGGTYPLPEASEAAVGTDEGSSVQLLDSLVKDSAASSSDEDEPSSRLSERRKEQLKNMRANQFRNLRERYGPTHQSHSQLN